jgi:hypothetical protein
LKRPSRTWTRPCGRSLEAYPEANHDAALASVGYVLGLNAAPVWWFHKPHAEVPLPIIYGASGLGKSELMRRVVEPAVVGADLKKRLCSCENGSPMRCCTTI